MEELLKKWKDRLGDLEEMENSNENTLFKRLECELKRQELETCYYQLRARTNSSNENSGLNIADVNGMLPLSKEHPCFDKGHSMYLVIEIDNGRSKYGDHRCSRCGHTEPFQYDY